MNVVSVDFRNFISSRQAADMMGINMHYLQRLKQLGALTPVHKVGQVNFYRKVDVVRYMESHPNLGLKADLG